MRAVIEQEGLANNTHSSFAIKYFKLLEDKWRYMRFYQLAFAGKLANYRAGKRLIIYHVLPTLLF